MDNDNKRPDFEVFISGIPCGNMKIPYIIEAYVAYAIKKGDVAEEITENYRRLRHLLSYVKSKKCEERRDAAVYVRPMWEKIKEANSALEKIVKEGQDINPEPVLNEQYAY